MRRLIPSRGAATVLVLLGITFGSAVVMLAGAYCIDAGQDLPPPAVDIVR